MIVDAHTHLGYDHVFEYDFRLEDLLGGMKKNRVDVSIVQPGSTFELGVVVKQHNAIAALSKKMPGRIYGMANPSPHLPRAKYRRELERCVKDLGFVAVKVHPLAHAVNPNGSKAKAVFEDALDLGIPVMVHTGSGVPWTLPSALIPVARRYPKLSIVVAHSGSNIFAGEAALAAELCPNVYLETTWLSSSTIHEFCKTLGADRIMFGSDHAANIPVELAKFRTRDLSQKELDWCLGRTAAKVFKIPVR
jgi:predicted TIM-barrel fold metal-dependent hydrolase